MNPGKLNRTNIGGHGEWAACCHTLPSKALSLCMLIVSASLLLSAAGCQHRLEHVPGIEVSLSSANFQEEVLHSNVPVLVDFGATWCGPCREMDPIVALISTDYRDRAKVGKVDVDESSDLAQKYGIEGLPTFVIFRDGEEVQRTIGTLSYRELKGLLDEALSASAASPEQ